MTPEQFDELFVKLTRLKKNKLKPVFADAPQNQDLKDKKDKDGVQNSQSTAVKQERTKDVPEKTPSTPSRSNTEEKMKRLRLYLDQTRRYTKIN